VTFYSKQFFPSTFFTAGYFTSSDGPGKITVYPQTARSRMYSNIPAVDATAEFRDSNKWGRRPTVIHRKEERPESVYAASILDGSRVGMKSGNISISIQNALSAEATLKMARSRHRSGKVSHWVVQNRTADILPSVSTMTTTVPILHKTNNPTESEIAMILMEFF